MAGSAAVALQPAAWAFSPASDRIAFLINVARRRFGALISPHSKTHHLVTVRELDGKFRFSKLVPIASTLGDRATLESTDVRVSITIRDNWFVVDSTGNIVSIGAPAARAADSDNSSGSSGSEGGGSSQPAPGSSGSTTPSDSGNSGSNSGTNSGSGSSDSGSGSGGSGGGLLGKLGSAIRGYFSAVFTAIGAAAAYATGSSFTSLSSSGKSGLEITSDGEVLLVIGGSSDSSNFMAPPPGVPEQPGVWY